MTVSIHFCLAQFGEQLLHLEPALEWKMNDVQQSMFIIRSFDHLDNQTIQLQHEGEVLWSSPLREIPKSGLVHPYTNQDDDADIYVTSKLLRKTDLVIHSDYYEVVIIEGGERGTTIPIIVKWKEDEITGINTEEAESSLDISKHFVDIERQQLETDRRENVNLILKEDTEQIPGISNDISVYEDNQNAHLEKLDPSNFETDKIFFEKYGVKLSTLLDWYAIKSNEYSSIEEKNKESVQKEINEDITAGGIKNWKEEVQIPDEPMRLYYNQKNVEKLLAEISKSNIFTVKMDEEKDYSSLGSYQIVIEKVKTSYIAVLNDIMIRPMYFMINGEYIHEWAESLESYLDWLKDQVMKMLNISYDEFAQWKKLVIIEDNQAELIDEENIKVISRKTALLELKTVYPTLIDIMDTAIQAQFTFEDSDKQLFIQIELADEEKVLLSNASYLKMNISEEEKVVSYINELLESWLSSFGRVPVMITGFGSLSSIRSQLSDKFIYASLYSNTNIAWEIAHVVRK